MYIFYLSLKVLILKKFSSCSEQVAIVYQQGTEGHRKTAVVAFQKEVGAYSESFNTFVTLSLLSYFGMSVKFQFSILIKIMTLMVHDWRHESWILSSFHISSLYMIPNKSAISKLYRMSVSVSRTLMSTLVT